MPRRSPQVPGIPDVIRPYFDRLVENLSRAQNLVLIYDHLYGRGRGRRTVHKTDLLRAAVVLLHASLEDFLRSVATSYLPRSDEAALNEIPLKGLNPSGRPEKFFLGKLTSYRGKTVDEVIQDSVASYLERSNYNDTQEIALLLQKLSIDPKEVSKRFADLQEMMDRRHQIVHRADRTETRGRGKQIARPIQPSTVTKWIEATREFMSAVVYQIYLKETALLPAP